MRVLKVQNFTFQSGSIQIGTAIGAVVGGPVFTFQSGSIQILFATPEISLLSTLHSNLVLFKYFRHPISAITKYLYIPIWFYSNVTRTA